MEEKAAAATQMEKRARYSWPDERVDDSQICAKQEAVKVIYPVDCALTLQSRSRQLESAQPRGGRGQRGRSR